MIFVLMGLVAGMARLMILAVCFTEFCVSSPNEREVTVVFGSSKRERMYVMYLRSNPLNLSWD